MDAEQPEPRDQHLRDVVGEGRRLDGAGGQVLDVDEPIGLVGIEAAAIEEGLSLHAGRLRAGADAGLGEPGVRGAEPVAKQRERSDPGA